jgi:hypothetical protein
MDDPQKTVYLRHSPGENVRQLMSRNNQKDQSQNKHVFVINGSVEVLGLIRPSESAQQHTRATPR